MRPLRCPHCAARGMTGSVADMLTSRMGEFYGLCRTCENSFGTVRELSPSIRCATGTKVKLFNKSMYRGAECRCQTLFSSPEDAIEHRVIGGNNWLCTMPNRSVGLLPDGAVPDFSEEE